MITFSPKIAFFSILGFILSAVFGYLAFMDFQWTTLKNITMGADPWLLTMAGLFLMTSILLRAYRWRYFLPYDKEFSYHSLVSGIAIGYFFSSIFPGRIGDILRPGYVSKASNQPFHIIFYSIVIERIFELCILFLFAITLLKYNGVLTDVFGNKLPVYYGIVFMGMFFLFFARQILSIILRISVNANWESISKPINEIIMAFQGNFRWRCTAILICLSVLIFFIDGLVFVCAIGALKLQVTFIGKFTTMVVTSLGHLFPSAPAGLGIFHYLCQMSLYFFGVEKKVGLSIAILVHAFNFLFDFVIGIIFIIFGPIKLVNIMNKKAFNNN